MSEQEWMGGFENWLKKVDALLVSVCGLDSGSLVDAPYYDNYENRTEPEEMLFVVLVEWNDMDEETFEQITEGIY